MQPQLSLQPTHQLIKADLREWQLLKCCWALGASFITEGAIPFAAEDPLRVIPSIMIGSGVAGCMSMLFGCALAVPHGGIWVLLIPNVVVNLPLYVLAILSGTVVSAIILSVIRKKVEE